MPARGRWCEWRREPQEELYRATLCTEQRLAPAIGGVVGHVIVRPKADASHKQGQEGWLQHTNRC